MLPTPFTRRVVCALPAALLTGCDVGKLLPGSAAASSAATTPRDLIHDGVFVAVSEASPLRKSRQVAAVETVAIETPISAPGVIKAQPEKMVKVTAPRAGRIVKLERSLGDPVKAGDALFTLHSANLSAAQGGAAKPNAALAQARRDLDRQKVLLDADIAPLKDYEAAQLAYAAATSDAQAARARLARAAATESLQPSIRQRPALWGIFCNNGRNTMAQFHRRGFSTCLRHWLTTIGYAEDRSTAREVLRCAACDAHLRLRLRDEQQQLLVTGATS